MNHLPAGTAITFSMQDQTFNGVIVDATYENNQYLVSITLHHGDYVICNHNNNSIQVLDPDEKKAIIEEFGDWWRIQYQALL